MPEGRLDRRRLLAGLTLAGSAGALEAAPAPAFTADEEQAIAGALGKKGTLITEQGVYTVPLPRGDLRVTVRGEPVPVPFGFGGWVSFKKTRRGDATVLMSDTVLLQEEVNGVISAAQAAGLEVTALHNHFFYEEPRIFYMHLHAMGEPAALAQGFAAAIRASKVFPANQPPAGLAPARTADQIFRLPELDAITGHRGVVNGPTYKYTLGRADLSVRAMDCVITAAMGLNSWASFTGTHERALVAGDIAMLEPEVNPVIATLRRHRVDVVALHHHMIGEQPRMVFLHYLGTGSAPDMARAFRAALDELGRHGKELRMKRMRGHSRPA